MTGLDKILQQISENGKAAADDTISKANDKAGSILQAAKSKAEKIISDAQAVSAKEEQNILSGAKSTAELERRKAILVAKQDEIAKTIQQAHDQILALPAEEYFSLLIRMIPANALPKEGILSLNERDLARVPEGFAARVQEAVQAIPGAKLTVSHEAVKIDGGFILSYGGIEENCSFESWFYAHSEDLLDQVSSVLFSVS